MHAATFSRDSLGACAAIVRRELFLQALELHRVVRAEDAHVPAVQAHQQQRVAADVEEVAAQRHERARPVGLPQLDAASSRLFLPN